MEDIELSLFEGRRNLVLTTLTRVSFPTISSPFLIAPIRRISRRTEVKLERISAGGGFRAAKHDADFHADLVNENNRAIGPLDVGGELAQGPGS